MSRCESYRFDGSLRIAVRCSRRATWEVDVKRRTQRVTEKRCAWHRHEGMNARRIVETDGGKA